MQTKLPADQFPALRALARPGAPPGARGHPLPAVLLTATWTDHQTAIHVEVAAHTGDDEHPWALVEDDLRVRHSRSLARLRRALDLPEGEPVTPELLAGAQCQVVLGAAADGGWRVRTYRPLFGGAPTPPHVALELQPGARKMCEGIVDDVEIDGSSVVLRLALDPAGDDPGAEPVHLVRRMLRTRDARVAGHELMSADGEWAFPPTALIGERVRAGCWVESISSKYGAHVVVGTIEAA